MPSRSNKRGVIILFVVVTIVLAVVLTTVMLNIISSQSRLVHHQVNRIRAYYADKAGMVLAFENLRKGIWVQDNTAINYYCINGPVDDGSVAGVPAITCLQTHIDADILCDAITPCKVQIGILPKSTPGISGTVKLKIKSDYKKQ